jgi:hypothetical protein
MSDPNYSSDKLFASYEVDFSDAIGHTATAHNTPTIVSATPSPPTGAGASAKFVRASSMYVDYGSSSDFNVGTGDFTAEVFFNLASLNSFGALISKGDAINGAANLGWGVWTAADATLYGRSYDGSTNALINAGSYTTATWYHVALQRASGTWGLYFGTVGGGAGSRLGTSTNASGDCGSTRILCVGADDNGAGTFGSFLNGDIAYARVTAGLARYAGTTYTLPTIPGDFTAPTTKIPYQPWAQLGPILAQCQALGRSFSGWRRRPSGLLEPGFAF